MGVEQTAHIHQHILLPLSNRVANNNGEGHQAFLVRLTQESGIRTPTREQLARLDRKRARKGLNQDWVNPHDPDARITNIMKTRRKYEALSGRERHIMQWMRKMNNVEPHNRA